MTIEVREIRYTDQGPILEAFPERDSHQLQQDQLAYMLGECLILVALTAIEAEEASESVIAVMTVEWQSDYTRFWQRHIPEIIDIAIVAQHRNAATLAQIVATAETKAFERGHRKVGWLLEGERSHVEWFITQAEKLGFVPDRNSVHYVKSITPR